MTQRFTFDIDHMIGRREVELRVTYSVTPGRTARLYGDYPHPEEFPEVELVSITHEGHPITLSDEEEDAIFEMAVTRSADDMADARADYEDHLYDAYRDRILDGERA